MVRKARIEDAARMAEIFVYGWRNAYADLMSETFLYKDLSVVKKYESIVARLADLDHGYYVYECSGIIKGVMIVSESRDEDLGPEVMELVAIYVEPVFRGKGIGSAMISAFEHMSQAQGKHKVHLWVLKDNFNSIQFYEKHGYAVDGKTKRLERLGLDEHRYIKNVVNKATFTKQLMLQYKSDPGSQPTAFWKMKNWLLDERTELTYSKGGVVSVCLAKQMLLRVPQTEGVMADDIERELVVLKSPVPSANKHFWAKFQETAYFKLVYHFDAVSEENKAIDDQLKLVTVLQTESSAVAAFINCCYDNMAITDKDVDSWRERDVFISTLWAWLCDANGTKLALGIAECDVMLKEGALEWIQVHPDHQGRGYGQTLVNALLNRLKETADFVTVSGRVDNITQPERLYRKCGFTGDAIWYVYQNKREQSQPV